MTDPVETGGDVSSANESRNADPPLLVRRSDLYRVRGDGPEDSDCSSDWNSQTRTCWDGIIADPASSSKLTFETDTFDSRSEEDWNDHSDEQERACSPHGGGDENVASASDASGRKSYTAPAAPASTTKADIVPACTSNSDRRAGATVAAPARPDRRRASAAPARPVTRNKGGAAASDDDDYVSVVSSSDEESDVDKSAIAGKNPSVDSRVRYACVSSPVSPVSPKRNRAAVRDLPCSFGVMVLTLLCFIGVLVSVLVAREAYRSGERRRSIGGGNGGAGEDDARHDPPHHRTTPGLLSGSGAGDHGMAVDSWGETSAASPEVAQRQDLGGFRGDASFATSSSASVTEEDNKMVAADDRIHR